MNSRRIFPLIAIYFFKPFLIPTVYVLVLSCLTGFISGKGAEATMKEGLLSIKVVVDFSLACFKVILESLL